MDQLNKILAICGTPSPITLDKLASARAQQYIESLPKMGKVSLHTRFPDCTPLALDFLEGLIQFDPDQRMTVEQALEHPYLDSYHVESDEPGHSSALDFSFERVDNLDDLRIIISNAIMDFKQKHTLQLPRLQYNLILTVGLMI